MIHELRSTLHLSLHACCTDSVFRTRAPPSRKSCETEWYYYYHIVIYYHIVSLDRVVNYHPIGVAIDNSGMLLYRIQIKYHNYFAWHSYVITIIILLLIFSVIIVVLSHFIDLFVKLPPSQGGEAYDKVYTRP